MAVKTFVSQDGSYIPIEVERFLGLSSRRHCPNTKDQEPKPWTVWMESHAALKAELRGLIRLGGTSTMAIFVLKEERVERSLGCRDETARAYLGSRFFLI